MLRLVVMALIAIAVVTLVLRFAPRLRARVMAVAALAQHPFVRQILFGLVFRLIRLLIFRR